MHFNCNTAKVTASSLINFYYAVAKIEGLEELTIGQRYVDFNLRNFSELGEALSGMRKLKVLRLGFINCDPIYPPDFRSVIKQIGSLKQLGRFDLVVNPWNEINGEEVFDSAESF